MSVFEPSEAVQIYEPFASDFGPLNLSCTYKFCQQTKRLLQEAANQEKIICFYCLPLLESKANAAVLVGAFQVLVLGKSAEKACESLDQAGPFCDFRDASSGPACFGLTVQSTIQGLAHAKQQGILDLQTFDLEDYDFYERVENGDSTWILPGPAAASEIFYGFKTKTPEDYWAYFRQKKVTAIVRLNKALYDGSRFTAGGFRHYELYFPDGSCPTEALVDQFLGIAESEGTLAIHCKAGLGRTGVLICCYLMKHHDFTAREALGYIRVCRPGSVIGPQQNFIIQQEGRMRMLGAAMRRAKEGTVFQPATPDKQEHASLRSKASPKKGIQGTQFNISCNASSEVQRLSCMNERNSCKDLQPSTPPSRCSRLSSFLRFKGLSVKGSAMPVVSSNICKSFVARAVAPNGQPRKIPAALLAAGEHGLKTYTADEDQPDSAKSDHWTINSSSLADCQTMPFMPLAEGMHSGSRSIDAEQNQA